MSTQIAPEHVCYVHCNFCSTILAVSVPCNSLFNIVTVRCGHCGVLLSVNMGNLLQTLARQDYQIHNKVLRENCGEYESSSKCNKTPMAYSMPNNQQQVQPMRPPEKRQRVPSAYNRFIKEEIQRIKANNPEISHREAFSAAAKNWAHFPRIHFGLTLDGANPEKRDEEITMPGPQKAQGFY
ncbi:protein YABBY 2-like [Ananas comosus]|uniref:Protein YABBY 2-like n=2 Tax=Ananas comosus TaxID=4615 RepID=A0A6P5FI46_ANACO|nr:protein YABBY 2-like [Ananas comosus]CAD1819718.1 unnamed protein product [Ananas comosus var. bracteatus]